MTVKEQEQTEETQALTGVPIILTIAIDPHSGQFSLAYNATNENQFRALAEAAQKVNGRMNQIIMDLAEQRIRSEIAEQNGQVNDG
jgi:hypothetical protein